MLRLMNGLSGGLIIIGLLTTPKNRMPNRLLAVTLLCALCQQWLLEPSQFDTNVPNPHWFRVGFPLELIEISTLFLYIKSMTTPGFRLIRSQLWFWWPACLGVVWFLALLLSHRETPLHVGPTTYKDYYLSALLRLAIVIPFLLRAQAEVRSFGRRAEQHVSDLRHLQLRWFYLLFVIIYAMLCLDAVDMLTGPNVPLWKLIPAAVCLSLVAMAVFSLRISPIFADELNKQAAEYHEQKRHLSAQELERLKTRLLSVLDRDALYLNPDLRLSDLAAAMKTKPYRVSEVLTRGLNKNFYELINEYRVKKARAMLTDPKASHLNLLGIATESGFKSRSVFNEIFKKTTGKSPSQYRANLEHEFA